MKKTMKHILALVIILPFLFAGCQKSETIESEKSTDNGFYKDLQNLCGDQYIANLVDYEETITAGTVTVGNDETMLYVTFQAATDWAFQSTILYVGSVANLPGGINGDGTGHFSQWLFPYSQGHGAAGTQEYTFSIDLDQLDDCFLVVAYCDAINGDDEYEVWGQSNSKTSGFYFEFCKQECEPPPPLGGCETAYAYGEDFATCFLNIPGVNSNNWGWSNGPISQGSDLTWDIYAGAGQCDITKGTLVGTLHVKYVDGTCTVTYNIDPDFTLDETHLYVGDDYLPKKKNKYKTAPGQFPYSGESSFTIDGLSGDIYVVAHSVVCDD